MAKNVRRDFVERLGVRNSTLVLVEQNIKTLVVRANDTVERRIVCDQVIGIQAERMIRVTVHARRFYTTLAETLKREDLERLAHGDTVQDSLTYLRRVISKEREAELGIVVFDLQPFTIRSS